MATKKPEKAVNGNGDPLALKLYIDPGDASVATIKAVLVALSNVYVAAGGEGLVFEEKEQLQFEAAGAVA